MDKLIGISVSTAEDGGSQLNYTHLPADGVAYTVPSMDGSMEREDAVAAVRMRRRLWGLEEV